MLLDELAFFDMSESDFVPWRRGLTATDSTALVSMIGFSKPMVTTRNGSPSESRTRLIGTPNLVVTMTPKRNAKTEEIRTEVASQALDPISRIDMKRDTNVRCIDRYPRTMMTMSSDSAFYSELAKA